MQILLSWIGHTDLRAMAAEQSPAISQKISEVVGVMPPLKGSRGPVRTLVEAISFNRIYLLSNYPKDITQLFLGWLGRAAEARYTSLSNPTDYGEIFAVVDTEMRAITKALDGKQYGLSILLSPGTPAMAAIWVLLGKTKYPARFYQTYENKTWITDIPFDLTVDFVPELLRGADSIFQHLASRSPQEIQGFERIAGDSQAIRLAVGRARKAALRDVPVLLSGESGTGKEMFARALHDASHRRSKPFLAMNCAAIPKQLLESELFGHERGAFTGADKKYEGAFQRAHGGTLFLDEVGECDPDIQAKLLRVLQPPPGEPPCTREFQPLGSTKALRTDVRVVAATNRDLLSMVQEGVFREDLFYRLAVITIKLPPLRERRSDIAKIADTLLAQINRDFERQEPGYRHKSLSDSARAFVARHAWPGNVRELYNVLLQAAVMSDKDDIGADDLTAAIAEMPTGRLSMDHPLELPLGDGFSLEKHLEAIHRHYLHRAMREAAGVKSKAARLLGMQNYQTLDAQLKRLCVEWEAK
jgi:transcriptional regulator with PAS, ATPase and Fis domain